MQATRLYLLRSSHRRCFVRKRCSYNFRKIYRKIHVPESLFLIKLQASILQLYLKRDPGTGVFLRILQNF